MYGANVLNDSTKTNLIHTNSEIDEFLKKLRTGVYYYITLYPQINQDEVSEALKESVILYSVVNKITNLVEFQSPSLPAALGAFDQLEQAISNDMEISERFSSTKEVLN